MKQNGKLMKQNIAKKWHFISLLLDAKILMRKEANNYFFSTSTSKTLLSRCFASFRFELKKIV
jgi:hypothetical protein